MIGDVVAAFVALAWSPLGVLVLLIVAVLLIVDI